jgi:oxalate decarboxylase
MDSPHVFHLLSTKPQNVTSGGTRSFADNTNFPVLKGMAIYRLFLKKGGVREPHWHPNANELAYCTKGFALVTVFGNAGKRETFTVSEGQMFFVPSGYLHHIENMGKDDVEMILAFSDDRPEDFGLSGSLGCMSDSVLGNTWGLSSGKFSKIKRSPGKIIIGKKKSVNNAPEYAYFTSEYKFDVEGTNPLLSNAGGLVKVARKSTWPALEKLSMYSLRITDKGMREPHWHPETAELGYVNRGKARMTILSPDGYVDTYKLEQGDIYFIPRAYPHHIENLGGDEFHFLVFFDQSTPGDIGFSGSVRAYSNEVLGASFNTDPGRFKMLPDYHEDLLIVSRVNRRD